MLQTDNLKLALYEPTDLANLTDGYNESMQILDDANQTINLLVTQEATRAKAKEAELLQAIGNETTRAEAEEKAIHEMVGDFNTLITNNTQNIEKNASAIKVIENKLETGDGTAYAPINHASTETTYGIATNTKYGHVKLTETPLNTTGEALDSNFITKMFNFNYQKTFSNLTGNSQKIYVMINESNTLFKVYGHVRVNPSTEYGSLTSIPGTSNLRGWKLDIDGKLSTTSAYEVITGGINVWADALSTSLDARRYWAPSTFWVGTDGNIYLWGTSTSSTGVNANGVFNLTYPACLYFAQNFNDNQPPIDNPNE